MKYSGANLQTFMISEADRYPGVNVYCIYSFIRLVLLAMIFIQERTEAEQEVRRQNNNR